MAVATPEDVTAFLALSASEQADLLEAIFRKSGKTGAWPLVKSLPVDVRNDAFDLLDALDASSREQAFRTLKEATGGAPVSIFREVADDGHFVVLSQTANVGTTGWQLSDLWYFEDRGRLEPVGHTEFSSRDEALKSMVGISGKSGPAVGYVGKYVFSEGRGYHWGREANPKTKKGNRR
jgi:hypothetical protein